MKKETKEEGVMQRAIQQRIAEQLAKFRMGFQVNSKYFQVHLGLLDRITKLLKDKIKALENWHFSCEQIVEQFSLKAKAFADLNKKFKTLERHVQTGREKKQNEPQLFYKGIRKTLQEFLQLQKSYERRWESISLTIEQVIQKQFIQNSKGFKRNIQKKYQVLFAIRERVFNNLSSLKERVKAQRPIPIEIHQWALAATRILHDIRQYGKILLQFWTEIVNQQTAYSAKTKFIFNQILIIYKQLHSPAKLAPLEKSIQEIDDSKSCQARLDLPRFIPTQLTSNIRYYNSNRGDGPLTSSELSSFLLLKHQSRILYNLQQGTKSLFSKRFQVQFDEGVFSKWKKTYLYLAINHAFYVVDPDTDQILDKMSSKGATFKRDGKLQLNLLELVKGKMFDSQRAVKLKFKNQEMLEEVQLSLASRVQMN